MMLELLAVIVFGVPVIRAQEATNTALQPKAKAAKGKSKAKAESRAKSKEEQERAEKIARKMREPFWKRLDEAVLEQLGTPAYTPPEPGATPTPRRIPPAPFDSPPYPSSDWQIGGSTIIGDPGVLAPYPLMQALYEGPNGDAWKDSKNQLYGWGKLSGQIT